MIKVHALVAPYTSMSWGIVGRRGGGVMVSACRIVLWGLLLTDMFLAK